MDAVYIHIPFCKKICHYCDFCKVLYHGAWVTQYLNALAKEIKERYNHEKISTIYIGGGTPSALNTKDLKYLFDILNLIDTKDGLEFTFECNLEDIREELLEVLQKNDVTRLSIGIQSFDPDKLLFMGRNHFFHDAQDKIALCRKYGFTNINVDLIYGIPGETLKMLKEDLDLFLKLKVEHISTYSLIVEDHTMIGITDTMPIPEELDAKMYELICKTLSKKGYRHYEISNFAKPGYESKHNLKYWNNEEYYGFGVGAAGYLHGIRYENTKSLTDYFDGKWLLKEELLSKQDVMDNELMLGLRKLEGISLQSFFDKYEVNLQEVYPIQPLLREHNLEYVDGYIRIPLDKLYVMNEILIRLL